VKAVHKDPDLLVVQGIADGTKHLKLESKHAGHLHSSSVTVPIGGGTITREIAILLDDGREKSAEEELNEARDAWDRLLIRFGLATTTS